MEIIYTIYFSKKTKIFFMSADNKIKDFKIHSDKLFIDALYKLYNLTKSIYPDNKNLIKFHSGSHLNNFYFENNISTDNIIKMSDVELIFKLDENDSYDEIKNKIETYNIFN